MNKIEKIIENQLAFNMQKNFFHEEAIKSMEFTPETLTTLESFREVDPETENLLLDYLTNRVLQEFGKVNQYYAFDSQTQKDLQLIYIELFSNIKNSKTHIEQIAKNHYANLKRWLLKANSFAEQLYQFENETIESVACYEYSADLQLKILQIDLDLIVEPVLDVGCGNEANLVKYLRSNGIEAYGCDRFVGSSSFLTRSDWFEFEYGQGKWGTIISNLGFSNHFNHHHLRNDGRYIEYAKTFLNILISLKIGGRFHYAPDLPFIEKYLDKNKFSTQIHTIGNQEFKSALIQRLK